MADIGNITGIAGVVVSGIALIVSIKAYAQVNKMKSLDLRLELEQSFTELDILAAEIEGILDYAFRSHQMVLAATGKNLSGEMKAFELDFAKDQEKLKRLLSTHPKREEAFDSLSPSELERRVVAVHALHTQLKKLKEKYDAIVTADGERRKEIRAQHAIPVQH